MNCNLCRNQCAQACSKNKHREFIFCEKCELISVPYQYWLSKNEEKERYKKHNNLPENEGYVRFLNEILTTVKKVQKKSPRILDFGCGERAVLTDILNSNGYDCTAYDPLFDINFQKDNSLFDIIILCEVIEHLKNIPEELNLINSFLKKDGVLIVRTRLYSSIDTVGKWWYAQDKTHINFFAKKTIETIAEMINRDLVDQVTDDIFIIA